MNDERLRRIDLLLHEGRARVVPAGYLIAHRFDRFKAACQKAGAYYSGDLKTTLAELDTVPRLIEALKAADFTVTIESMLAHMLRLRAEYVRADICAATLRLDMVRTQLEAQGLGLYPFQVAGVAWLAPKQKALLADEMGLGKTIQALIAAPSGPGVLVVCPAAVKGVWALEASRWRPDLEPMVLAGRNSFRWPGPGELVILNYDILPPTKAELRTAYPPPPEGVTLIADECHALKSGRSLRTKRFRELARMVRKFNGRTWGLTGTPLLNRAPELWAVLTAFDLAQEAYGSWMSFKDIMGGRQGIFGMEWGDPKPIAAECLRRVSLCRRRHEVLPDLPTKTYRVINMAISQQAALTADAAVATMAEKGLELVQLEATEDLDQALGMAFEQLAAARKALAAAKIDALLELVAEYEGSAEPLVVFSAHRPPIDILGNRQGWAAITGDTPHGERAAIVARFQAGELKGVALTIKAGGVGLTLTKAAHVVFVDREWTPALNTQAEDRVCRIGQDRGVVVTDLVAKHPLDERVAMVLGYKGKIIGQAVTASAVLHPVAAVDPAALEQAAELPPPTELPNEPWPRRAANELETWAEVGLVRLAEAKGSEFYMSGDHELGINLARRVYLYRTLTPQQWDAAIGICRRWPALVGPEPQVV